MLQAAFLDCQFLDLYPFSDGFAAPKIDVGGHDLVQPLAVARVVIIVDECPPLSFQTTRRIVLREYQPRPRILKWAKSVCPLPERRISLMAGV